MPGSLITPFTLLMDNNGLPTLATPQYSLYNDSIIMNANTRVDVTKPTGAKFVIFTPDSLTGNLYVNLYGNAVVPNSTTTDGSAPILNPKSAYIGAPSGSPYYCTTISMISPIAMKVILSYYI